MKRPIMKRPMMIAYDATYYDNHIEGWMGADELWYLYKEAFKLDDGDIIVEIGCYKGRSTHALGSGIRDSGKKIKLFCVDPFLWYDGMYEEFLSNVKEFNLEVIRDESIKAAGKFDNESVAFLFEDGNHSYEAVKGSIEAWLPKIKSGYKMTGHDYTRNYEGVIPAVQEKFGKNITRRPYSIWEYVKPKNI